MKTRHLPAILALVLGAFSAMPSEAQQITFSEDFTGANSANSWYFFSGACLTAGSSTSLTNPGPIPGCSSVWSRYYSTTTNSDPYLVGGNSGFLGNSSAPSSGASQQADPAGSGALRFTNGSLLGTKTYGHNQRGAILSTSTFPTDAGIQVTFKTVTYHGDSQGAGGDGADGISFFLQDGSVAPGLGAFGGSLAYSCANNNLPYDGLNGGYIGLGIDEYGNFLNGSNLAVGYTGTNVATGDNSAYGYGYKPGRIGLRGAGSVAFPALTAAYGTDPGDPTKPFYPASLNTSCTLTGGTYSSATNNCINICSAGSTFYAPGQVCNKACTGGGVYDSGSNTCQSCASVNGTYSSGLCTSTNSCSVGTYFNGTATCDTCPATGYATGTYGSGQCSKSCATGFTLTGTSCYPNGSVYSTGFYCPNGSTIVSNGGAMVCYPAGLSYTAGNYCPSGQTITGTVCYPTGASHSGTNYCATGQTLSGTSCYPTGDSNSGTKYCPSGFTIQGTTGCYPTGLAAASRNTTNYCATGQTISTASTCYPTISPANVYGSGFYCPSGNVAPTTAGMCCPTGTTYSAVTGKCSNGTLPSHATPVTASTVMSVPLAMTSAPANTAATAATAATAVTASTTVAANQAPTQNTTPINSAPATLAPTTSIKVDAQWAVQNTCNTGNLFNYSTVTAPTSASSATLSNPVNTKGILDYAPIPNAYSEVTSFQIANEAAATRLDATAIFYTLKITSSGLLSFGYSVSGGSYTYLIRDQSITASNGPLPASFRVGFAASDGGASNVHEIMCFKAASANQSSSSATINDKQAAKVEAGTQAYFAYYNPNNWTGTVTANTLINTNGVVTVASTANWDASCLLTGTTTGAPAAGGGCPNTNTNGPTSATPTFDGRVMITWDTANSVGIPFEWTSLNSAQQNTLSFGDAIPSSDRLDYLRGKRANEIQSNGVGLFRERDTVLGDIVDSSPAWVGPPSQPYTAAWRDRLLGGSMPENSGTQNYLQFTAAEQTRQNVVYVGANDGFVHAFRAGSFDASGNFVDNATTPNDGKEVLAYMPGASLASAALASSAGGCTDAISSETTVQNIHGVTPAVGMNAQCSAQLLDFTAPQYGHNFFIDATPSSGDLFYGGQWHTWLVGGLGAGGALIYALDVTDSGNFSEGNAASIVKGEWTASTITCATAATANCGTSLGNTFGTPQIRRLHNGNWGVIFGNGFNSSTGDAGIYVMSIDSSSGATTFYYLSTHATGANGIAFTSPTDLDGDHITDYVYAGDLQGHVWRFDLTSNDPRNWAAGSTPLFTTQGGQPITSQLLAISINSLGSLQRLLIEFGTGARTQLNNLGPATYATGTQSLYGVWDWNFDAWNTQEPGAAYATLDATVAATGLSAPYTIGRGNLAQQTLALAANQTVGGTSSPVCWQGSALVCSSANTQFGWYADLPTTSEQIIFNPVFFQGAFLVNSTIPANNVATSCTSNLDTGYTYALAVATGGIIANVFSGPPTSAPSSIPPSTAGVQTNASGSLSIVTTSQGTTTAVFQRTDDTHGTLPIYPPKNTKSKRLTWIEQR